MRKFADLVAAVIEYKRVPVGMFSLPGIGMLVEVGTVEVSRVRLRPWESAPGPNRGSPRSRVDAGKSTRYMKSAGVPKRLVGAK